MLFGWLLPFQLIALGTVWTICSLFCQHASGFRCSFHFFWKLKNGCGVKLRMFARHAVRRIFHRKDNNLYPTVVPLPPIIAGIQRHSVHRKKNHAVSSYSGYLCFSKSLQMLNSWMWGHCTYRKYRNSCLGVCGCNLFCVHLNEDLICHVVLIH